MAHPSGAGSRNDLRLDFDRRVRLEFRGAHLSSDGGLLIVRELDDALGLSDLAAGALTEHRTGANRVHLMTGLFRQVRIWAPRRATRTSTTPSGWPMTRSCGRSLATAPSMGRRRPHRR